MQKFQRPENLDNCTLERLIGPERDCRKQAHRKETIDKQSARMMFYRAPTEYSRSVAPYPYHQAMLVHYGRPFRRNAQLPASEVAAFAAGDTIGTGSYLQSDGDQIEYNPQQDSTQQNDGNSVAVAEAYPELDIQQSDNENEKPIKNDVFHYEDELPIIPSIEQFQDPLVQIENGGTPVNPIRNNPPEAEISDNGKPINEVKPQEPPTKKKKPRVDLDDSEEDNGFIPIHGQNGNYPWPMNSFFPLNFGSTSGGAIAVANSFSTGKGGTATSHATAYGSALRQKPKNRQISD